MRFPLFVAVRYLFSKKTHNVINIISGVSVAGITVGTMALIVVLSVFNGFESMVLNLFNSYNPELVIVPAKGKTIPTIGFPMETLRQIEGVTYISKVQEEKVLFRYQQNQVVASLKGVDREYLPMNRLDTMLIDGVFVLSGESRYYAVFGSGVAYHLGANINDLFEPITVYYPNRQKKVLSSSDMGSFNTSALFPSGVFSVQQEYDNQVVITDIALTTQLFDYDSVFTSLEIGLSNKASVKQVKRQMETLLGSNYRINDRFQQQELLYKVLRSEKLFVFLILAFILLIAVFNVVGSLTMLILDKKRDIYILQGLGADLSVVRRIFMSQGLMISLSGALAGLFLGTVICLLQMQFGLLRLPDSEALIIDHYPVVLKAADYLLVFSTITIIGFLATWVPIRRIGFSNH